MTAHLTTGSPPTAWSLVAVFVVYLLVRRLGLRSLVAFAVSRAATTLVGLTLGAVERRSLL
jgi:hypothetical protein